jgi:hypothetical protein
VDRVRSATSPWTHLVDDDDDDGWEGVDTAVDEKGHGRIVRVRGGGASEVRDGLAVAETWAREAVSDSLAEGSVVEHARSAFEMGSRQC